MKLDAVRTFCRFLYAFPGTGLPRGGEVIRRIMARWAFAHPEKAILFINDFCGDLNFYCDLSEHMGSQIYFRGSYSGDQLTVLLELLTPDAIFVDAGANQGEFTVCAAGALPRGQVFSFEPVAKVRERLERNVQANGFDNVTIYEVGLSDAEQDDVPIFGAQSKFADGTQHIGLPTLFDMNGRSEQLDVVNLRRLDDILPEGQRIDVIKVDVEGAELAVLRGAETTILREKPAIIFEANAETCKAAGYSVENLCDWLLQRGYALERIGQNGDLAPVSEQVPFSNILARHPDRRSMLQTGKVS